MEGLMYPYPRSPFSRFAKWTAHASGHPLAFVFAAVTIGVWLITGPLFGFSDTWQLVINTGTTIVTFLMVFLIQNTQNRDSAAVHLKLDELIRTVNGAHNALLDLEELTETDLERLRSRYESLGRNAREDLLRGLLDTDTPDVPVEGRRMARGSDRTGAASLHDIASNEPARHDDFS
jgi:low affinity Fe/Cu permease